MTSSLESGAVPSGWLWIVTLGTQVFHSPYLQESRKIWKTREAGAEILVEAEAERIASRRDTVGLHKPSWGGQVAM